MKNIADVVGEDKKYSNLNRVVIAADMKKELSGQGPFTIFAPTDIAFGKLHEGEFLSLQKPENKKELADLLGNHIIKGKAYYRDLKDGQKLSTINGKTLTVHVKDGVKTIEGAVLENRETEGVNGVILPVDLMFKLS